MHSVPTASPVLKRNLASTETLTFSWHSVPCGSRHGNVTHYEYSLRVAGQSEEGGIVENSNTTERAATFDDPLPCTSYAFKVRAYTIIGPGPWTAETYSEIDVIGNQDTTFTI